MTTAFTTSDITTILGQFGDISSFLKRYLPSADSIPGLSKLIGDATKPLAGFDAAKAHVSMGSDDSTIAFTLPDNSTVSFIVGNDILQKIAAHDNSFLLAVDYQANPDSFKSLFANTPFDGLAPSSSEVVVSTQGVTSVGGVDVPAGISVIDSFNVASSSNAVLKFLHNYTGVNTVSAIVSAGPDGEALSGDVTLNKTLKVGGFQLTYQDVNFSISYSGGVPTFTGAQVLTLSGYDPTQNAPLLTVNTGFKFDPTSVSLYGQMDAAGWANPFGIMGTTINTLGLQVGLTYAATGIDNLGFVIGLVQKIDNQTFDYTLDLAFDINTPSHDAFQLTVNQPVNLVELELASEASAYGIAGKALFAKLEPLFNKYLPITLMSSTVDGALAPLLKAVPFDTTIAATHLTAGYGVNARVDVLGEVGTLSLNASADLTQISGSLDIPAIHVGSFLSISGADGTSDLTASFNLDAASKSLSLAGSGKIAVEGFTIAQADFNITSSQVAVNHTFLDFGIARFDIDHLNLNLSTGAGSGLADITVAGQKVLATSFTTSSQLIAFDTKLTFGGVFSLDGHMKWDDKTHELDGSGSAKIGDNDVANASLKVLSNGSVSITGSLDLTLPDHLGGVSTSLTATYDNNSHATNLNVQADVSGLGHISLDIGANDDIAKAIANEITGEVGQQVYWVANAVASGATSLLNAGTYTYAATQITDFVNNSVGEVGDFFNQLFGGGHHHDANKTLIDNDGGHELDVNGGNDIIFGNGGNDTLQGHQGNDVLDGGTGNDNIYAGSDNDVVNGGNGNDYVEGQGGHDTLYGGAGDDVIYGDWSDGKRRSNEDSGTGYNDGNDELHGGLGNDYLNGSYGNDTLYGDSGNDSLDGGAGNNVLYGGSGDDQLTSTLGVATMSGGTGNDTYFVDNAADVVMELPNQGVDLVRSSVSFTLPSGVENLILTNADAVNGTGNDLDNLITGNVNSNVFFGGGGNDTIDGGGGREIDTVVYRGNLADYKVSFDAVSHIFTITDSVAGRDGTDQLTNIQSFRFADGLRTTADFGVTTVIGGPGDDTYVVNDARILILENPGEGTDTVNASVPYTLPANVENLVLTGTSAINGAGNELNNALTGNSANNVLSGGAGDDVLFGAAGNDTLTGGPGHDVFLYYTEFSFSALNNGMDVVTDFSVGDVLRVMAQHHNETLGETFNANSFVSSKDQLGPNKIFVSNDPATGLTLFQVGGPPHFPDVDFQLKGLFVASDFSASGTDIWLVNHAPTGSPTAILAPGIENAPYTLTLEALLQGFHDQDGDVLSITNLSVTGHGTGVDNGNGSWTITPSLNYTGPLTLAYQVSDGNGGLKAAVQSFNVVTAPPQGAPTAVLPAGTEDTAYQINASALLTGFHDVEGAALSVAGLVASHGSLAAAGSGIWLFTPEKDYNGPVALTYKVTDIRGGSVAAIQNFSLNPVNDAAILSSADVMVMETNARIVATGVLSISDVDSPATFVAQPATAGTYGRFTLDTNGAWTYTASSAYDYLNPGDTLTDSFQVRAADGTATHVSVTIAGTADTTNLHLGDAPARQSGAGGQWAQAWTQAGVVATHKADVTNAAEAWSAVTLSGVSPQTLAGGDIYIGDLGVSGQSANTSAVRQEIDGKEALRIALAANATSVTLKLANLFTNDDGTAFSESGLLRLLDANGKVVGEQAFVADAADGSKTVTLSSTTSFTAIELLAGAYDSHGVFVYGGYSTAAGGFGSAITTDAQGGQHGSDFLLASVDLTVMLVGLPA